TVNSSIWPVLAAWPFSRPPSAFTACCSMSRHLIPSLSCVFRMFHCRTEKLMTIRTVSRPDYEIDLAPFTERPVERSLPLAARLWQYGWLRKGIILVVLAVIWELVARYQANDLLLPGAMQTAQALYNGLVSGELLIKSAASLK